MPKRLALSVGFTGSPEENAALIEKVKIAEEVGVEAVFTAETWGRDQFSLLTQLALNTERIKLGSGIAPVFGRSPAVLAMTFATLDELSGGRMIIGLGTSGSRVIEHWHGQPFEKPLQRLREYVEIINMIIRGERLNYEGEIFQLQRGFRLLFTPVREHIPVYIASISPKSMRQVGEVADGWMPIYWPKSQYVEGKSVVAEGARAARRDEKDVEVVASITTVIEDDLEKAKMQAAGPTAFYVTRMGDFYHRMLSRQGFPEEVDAMRKAFEENREDPNKASMAAIQAMSDKMIDETAVYGPLDRVREGLDERRSLGVDMPIIAMPQGSPQEVERILGTLVS